MSYKKSCYTNDFEFGADSQRALSELQGITESGNSLGVILSAVTLFNIFNTRNYHKVVKNIAEQDWEVFAQSLIGLNQMAKNSASRVVWGAYEKTEKEEKAFWACMLKIGRASCRERVFRAV